MRINNVSKNVQKFNTRFDSKNDSIGLITKTNACCNICALYKLLDTLDNGTKSFNCEYIANVSSQSANSSMRNEFICV